ncbi:PTS system cellobiose-specific IIB component [Neobacillus niacini]|jgi:PTS system cellobiose-specific IIB component|uniref:PTS sugar transporter subunit IIB n=1 Tax=Neobacillus niacini TaxID=86668 RepID=UPI0027843981|nr:PTS sugar transporter subunit IIB [Neobacillus niacini]MDQ1000649.1 PTS system cellobiose-specific IIB component [Neobacillus niacini]
MNIILVCFAGMSTSMLVSKMEKIAAERGIEANISAMPATEIYDELDGADVVLLGPQARYALDKVKSEAEPKGIPVAVIDSILYGTMNGGAVLDMALEMAKK